MGTKLSPQTLVALKKSVPGLIFLVSGGILALGSSSAEAAKRISPQCQDVDIESAQSIFACVGTIRYGNGQSRFSRMAGWRCADFTRSFYREIGRATRMEAAAVPSCDTVAEVAELMTGNKPYWSACTGYPSADPAAHMRRCMESFAPGYYGSGFRAHISSCSKFRKGYELALKMANRSHNQRVPEGYVPAQCDKVNEVIASLTGGTAQGSSCMGYDPARVKEHLVACVAAKPSEYRQLRDCVSIRSIYEQRLRATHGGLPENYSTLSCADAQAALDTVIAYNEKKDAERKDRALASEKRRQEQMNRQRETLEVARDKIRERQQTRGRPSTNCKPRPARYPEDKYNYPHLLKSLQAGCAPALTPHEQLFVAGLGHELTSKCRLPNNLKDRLEVAKFIAAALPVGMGGSKYGDPNLGEMMKDQVRSQEAYMAGAMAFKDFDKGCKDPRAVAVANSLTNYVKTTASNSSWVDGCDVKYATLYSRGQCQCMANAIRGIDPSIHSKPFSRDSIKRLIGGNPLGALQMATQCGVGDY